MPGLSKHLDEIKGELEREVFLAAYRSRRQCLRRARAAAMILGVHLLRGALIGLPIYLAILALLLSPLADRHPWYLAILLPGIAGWLWVLLKGARADYRRLVDRRLLDVPFAYALLSDDAG